MTYIVEGRAWDGQQFASTVNTDSDNAIKIARDEATMFFGDFRHARNLVVYDESGKRIKSVK